MIDFDTWGLRFMILGAIGIVMNRYFLRKCQDAPIVVGMLFSIVAFLLGLWFLIIPKVL